MDRSLVHAAAWAGITMAACVLQANPLVVDFDNVPDFWHFRNSAREAYGSWGIHFSAVGVDDMPVIHPGSADGTSFAEAVHCSYPPGFNIVMNLDTPCTGVSAEVMAAGGVSVRMVGKDAAGTTVVTVTSTAADSFWKGTISMKARTPLTRIEWWPSEENSGVGIDNLHVVLLNRFKRGDANGDGKLNIADPISTLQFLFAAGSASTCEAASDANDDGKIDVADALYALGYLLQNGPVPPAPFGACGTDTTQGDLTCENYLPCPFIPLLPEEVSVAKPDDCLQCSPCTPKPIEVLVEELQLRGIEVLSFGYAYTIVCRACGCPSGTWYVVWVGVEDAWALMKEGWSLCE